MKHLSIRYGDLTLFDADIEELVFTDNDTGIKVEGRLRRAAAAGLGTKNILDILASASKKSVPDKQEPTSE